MTFAVAIGAVLEAGLAFDVKTKSTAMDIRKLADALFDELDERSVRYLLVGGVASLFGRRSEKLPPIRQEVKRLAEEDERTVEGAPMPKDEQARDHERRRVARNKSEPERKKKRGARRSLPIVKERIEVALSQLPQGTTRADFREVGDGDVVRRVEHIREHLLVKEYHLQTLASRDGEVIVKASPPPGVTEKGHYGASVYAHVITAKCADSLPLHRIERQLEREGAAIARSTLCSLFHRAARLLAPLHRRLLREVARAPHVHADETTFDILQEGGCKRGWIWAALSKQAIAYVFDESRGGEVATRILGKSKGTLLVDGYSGYNGVTADDGRDRVACWGHYPESSVIHDAITITVQAGD